MDPLRRIGRPLCGERGRRIGVGGRCPGPERAAVEACRDRIVAESAPPLAARAPVPMLIESTPVEAELRPIAIAPACVACAMSPSATADAPVAWASKP